MTTKEVGQWIALLVVVALCLVFLLSEYYAFVKANPWFHAVMLVMFVVGAVIAAILTVRDYKSGVFNRNILNSYFKPIIVLATTALALGELGALFKAYPLMWLIPVGILFVTEVTFANIGVYKLVKWHQHNSRNTQTKNPTVIH